MMSRRAILAMLGVDSMIGQFSQYGSTTHTPSSSTSFAATNPLGVTPKLVIAYVAEESATNKIAYLVLTPKCGALRYTTGTSNSGAAVFPVADAASVAASTFFMDGSQILIQPVSSSRSFFTGQAYTVEVYA